MVVMRPGSRGTGAVCGISPALRVFSLPRDPKLGWKSGAPRVTVLAPSQTVFIHSWTTRNQVGVKEMSMTLVKKIALVGLAMGLAFPMIAPAESTGACTFKAKCAMCHGSDGSASTGMGKSMGLKPLGSPEVQKVSDADMTALVTNGKGKMPAFKGKLSDDEISAVVKYVHTLK